MNHLRIYESIIQTAKFENRIKLRKTNTNYVYYENHHILPRCLGGTDDKENLVLLTAREHYVCHKLLTYIYKGNRKIALAFHKMTYGIHKNKYNTSSRDYAYAKELLANTPISQETRKKLGDKSKQHTGTNSAMYGKHHSEKTKQHLSAKLKGRIVSEETKQKQREANIGEKNPMFGKHSHFLGKKLSTEEKEYLSNLYLGKTIEELYGAEKALEIKNKISNKLRGRKQSAEEIEKRRIKLKGIKRTEEQKTKTSETTKIAMQRPEVKEKHRIAMEKLKLEREQIRANQNTLPR
jgi:hypothetical protein